MKENGHGRRRFLYRAGIVAATGALAGCASGSGGGSSGGNTETEATTTARFDAATESTTATGSSGSDASAPFLAPAPTKVDRFLTNANFYDGNMVVGESRVAVGAGQKALGFDPAAIEVSTGTEVTWEWSSGVEPHTVTPIGQVGTEEPRFGSGKPRKGEGIVYRHTFGKAGIYRYVCRPHRDQGARGAIIVRDGPLGTSAGGNESG